MRRTVTVIVHDTYFLSVATSISYTTGSPQDAPVSTLLSHFPQWEPPPDEQPAHCRNVWTRNMGKNIQDGQMVLTA